MESPQLVLIRGASGSGKTTYAKTQFPGHYHFEADNYFVGPSGVYVFDYTKLPRAHNECLASTVRALAGGHAVVVANTFVRLQHLRPYLDLTEHCTVFRMTRLHPNCHNVPRNTVLNQLYNMEPLSGEILVP